MGDTKAEMGAAAEVSATASRRPTITLPPRPPFETLFAGGSIPGYSPGPMTLLSSSFSPDSNSCSFSQLLAGAMASPLGKPTFLSAADFSAANLSKDVNSGEGNDKGLVVVAQSPLFLVPPGLSPYGSLSPLQSPFGMSHQQALAHVTAQAALSQSLVQIQADFPSSSTKASAEVIEPNAPALPSESLQQKQMHTALLQPQNLKMGSAEASQSDKRPSSFAADKPTNDGYNWRKYGQKLVKAKEHPRSYYKCTHPNCPVKKKVERGTDGQITEITYKGQHNHELPQPSERAKDGSGLDGAGSYRAKSELSSQGRSEMEISTEAASSHPNNLKQEVSTQLSEQFPLAGEHDMEDCATVIDEDNDDDEPNAKRRSTKIGTCGQASSHKTDTKPKTVVQIRSEVDNLDDGYKWRKYGQKAVKGNPYPRSYYRCTFVGCNVRKHVERASTDPKAVITTYEGKHNHEMLAGRNCSQNIGNATAQLKPQKTVARKPSVHRDREVDFENKDQIPVLPQLKEGEIAA